MMDLVHIWYDDRYWSKILCSTIHNFTHPKHDLKVKVTDRTFMLKFYDKSFRTSLFLNSVVFLFHVWHDDRCWSKILCSTIPNPVYDFKVKVTDLEFLYCNFLQFQFFS